MKKRAEGNGGSQKKVAATSRGMTHCAGVAWRKGCGHTEPRSNRDDGKSRPGTMLQGKPRKDDVREETSGETENHQWNKEPKLKTAAMSEEGEDSQQQHQRAEQEMESTSGKQDNTWQNLQEDHRVGGRKANIVRTSIRLQKMTDWTLRRGRPPPK
jgi:hypothetical protein